MQKKNHHRPTGHDGYVFDRESPGHGFHHVVSKRDIQAFIDIIPDWHRYSERLERIVLARPGSGYDGFYEFYQRDETGSIFLNAWSDDLWINLTVSYFDSHREIFTSLGLSHESSGDNITCRFTEAQARAFMLLHVFMHELGHHYDRIHQKHFNSSKGESYAEKFATNHFKRLFPAYIQVFEHPNGVKKLEVTV